MKSILIANGRLEIANHCNISNAFSLYDLPNKDNNISPNKMITRTEGISRANINFMAFFKLFLKVSILMDPSAKSDRDVDIGIINRRVAIIHAM